MPCRQATGSSTGSCSAHGCRESKTRCMSQCLIATADAMRANRSRFSSQVGAAMQHRQYARSMWKFRMTARDASGGMRCGRKTCEFSWHCARRTANDRARLPAKTYGRIRDAVPFDLQITNFRVKHCAPPGATPHARGFDWNRLRGDPNNEWRRHEVPPVPRRGTAGGIVIV